MNAWSRLRDAEFTSPSLRSYSKRHRPLDGAPFPWKALASFATLWE